MSTNDLSKLRELLESQHEWPTNYTFKFIVPADQIAFAEQLFLGYNISKRPSKTGKYTSFTIELLAQSPDQVIDVYKMTASIKGVIAL